MANMGAPPILNLLGEIVSLAGRIRVNWSLGVQLGGLVFLGGAYTLILFSASQQGQKKTNAKYLRVFSFQENLNLLMLTAPLAALSLTVCLF
jgi:NADH:ubiquinone oxidoreductase subunit 4 (subunit M)